LGAFAVEYLPNFYGTMKDSINAGDESDRIFAYWPVVDNVAIESATTNAVALKNVDGRPQIQSIDPGQAFWVELPEDIEALRKQDLSLVKQWRAAVREALQPALDQGWFIRSVNADRTAILVEPSTSDYEFQEEQ
jgi:predicted GNAT superfamily acetyltransferase